MKNSKNRPSNNSIQSKSNLFLQLGLIVALIIVYTLLEFQFVKTSSVLPKISSLTDESKVYTFETYTIVRKEKIKNIKRKIKPKLLNEFTIENSDENLLLNDSLLINIQTPVDFDSIFSEVPLIDNEPEESLAFDLVEQAPRFPGCKGKNEKEFKNCFNKKMKSFVKKKFHPNTDIGLTGKLKVFVLFEIDKNGEIININIKSPHKRLEKEAFKMVKKLPKMIPGKQGSKNIGVKYVLPISIIVE